MISLAVIGCGNMSRAILQGLSQFAPGEFSFHLYNPSKEKAQKLAAEIAGKSYQRLAELPVCDVVMLGFKPQQLGQAQRELTGKIASDSLLVSMLAAISTTTLMNAFKHKHVLRIMPNLPVAFGKGVTSFVAPVPGQLLEKFLASYRKLGTLISMKDDKMLDATTAFSGSTPALYYWQLHQLSTLLEKEGMTKSDARAMCVGVLQGVATVLESSKDDFSSLKEAVTSKKGVTAEMLSELEESQVPDILARAMKRAEKRGQSLAQEIAQQLNK